MFYRQYGGARTLCVIAVVAVGLAFTASAVATIGNKLLGDAPTKANSQESADSLVLLQRHAAADPSVTAASSQDISFEQRVRDEIEETAETWTPRRDIDRGGQDSGNRLQRKGRGRGSKRKRMERGRKASLKQRRKFNKKRKRLKLRTQILEMATPVHLSDSPQYRNGKKCTLVAPSGGVFISTFGNRTLPNGRTDFHNGIDIQECMWDEHTRDLSVLAAADGVVVRIVRGCPHRASCKSQSGDILHSGNQIVLAHPELGVLTSYSHLDNILGAETLSLGASIKAGTKIGRMGKSGSLKLAWRETLHFQVTDSDGNPVDPCMMLKCPRLYGNFRIGTCGIRNKIKCRFHIPNSASRFCRPLTKAEMSEEDPNFEHPLPKRWDGFVGAFKKFINKLHDISNGDVPSWDELPKCELPPSCPDCKASAFPSPCLSTEAFQKLMANPAKVHALYYWMKQKRKRQRGRHRKDWNHVWRLYYCMTNFRLKDSGGGKFFMFSELQSALPVSPAILLEEGSEVTVPNKDLTQAQRRACSLCSDTAAMALRLLNQYNMTAAAVQRVVGPVCETIRSQREGTGLKCSKLVYLLGAASPLIPRQFMSSQESVLHNSAQQYARALPWCHAAGLSFCRATVAATDARV